jgi:hypothetical protein
MYGAGFGAAPAAPAVVMDVASVLGVRAHEPRILTGGKTAARPETKRPHVVASAAAAGASLLPAPTALLPAPVLPAPAPSVAVDGSSADPMQRIQAQAMRREQSRAGTFEFYFVSHVDQVLLAHRWQLESPSHRCRHRRLLLPARRLCVVSTHRAAAHECARALCHAVYVSVCLTRIHTGGLSLPP